MATKDDLEQSAWWNRKPEKPESIHLQADEIDDFTNKFMESMVGKYDQNDNLIIG